MRKLSAQFLLIFGSLCFSCSSVCYAQTLQSEKAASINVQDALPNKSETVLRKDYERFLTALDTNKIAKGYPKAIQNLKSADSEIQKIGLATLSASSEVEVIPFIVPFLDSPDSNVRIWAGMYLEKLVSPIILKQRRNMNYPNVVINPLRQGDFDFRPLSWVIYRMLQKRDDGNTHAFAATMIGYIGLKEFEPELRQLLKSEHPAVTIQAKHALKVLNWSEEEAKNKPSSETDDNSQERDILDFADKNPRKSQVQNPDGSWRIPKYGDYKLEQAVKELKNYAQPFTVPKLIVWYTEAKDEKTRANLLRVLAASRDARAALVIGNSLKDESLDVRIAATDGLLDYFILYSIAGGSEQQMMFVQDWWEKNREKLERQAKYAEWVISN
jgi:hypothetical protein